MSHQRDRASKRPTGLIKLTRFLNHDINTTSSMQRERPVGITPIGLLDITGDSIFLIAGIVLFIAIPAIANNPKDYGIESSSLAFKLLASSFGYVIAGSLAALGIANTGASIGLLLGKQWAWNLTVVLAFISVATDITAAILYANTSSLLAAIVGCILDGVILYYLYRPNVREYFGKITHPVTTSQSES